MSEQTKTNLYGLFVALMVLAVCIAYARVTTELKIEGEGDASEQQGVYITDVAYLTDNGADTDNSNVNFYIGTMLDSKVVLGSSSSSTITYKVTVKNNTDREQVFIGIVKDETNEGIYSNTNIQPNVATVGELAGLEQYVTTIAPGETLTFPVTFRYAGTDTSNPELQSKINFRFREKPILELSNNGETYTLEDISAGYEEEYEFTVSNYNETYNNGVPLTYSFETILTEGSPLTAKIYDEDGNEVTESITLPSDGSATDHTYTLKLTWDSSLNSSEYRGQTYKCELILTAIPNTTVDADLADYADYKIEKGFEIDITTSALLADGSWDGEINTPVLMGDMEPVAWDAEGNEFTPKTNAEWYDYTDQAEGTDGTSNWANAKTSDGSYWVWVPRYEYKIDASNVTSTSDAGTIDINFIPITTNATTEGYATTTGINQTVNGVEVLSKGITVSSDGYIIHPSFTSDVNTGGWDSELPGFWVAKYEMSMETNGVATTTSDSSIGNVAISDTIKAVSKPLVSSWRYINASNMYENSLNYDTSKESHLIKNSEWGAVAYLTHSFYGRNGTRVDVNHSVYTGSTTDYLLILNLTQSSTGNISGVFDLSGGAYEIVAAFNDAYSSAGDYFTGADYLSASGNNMGAIGLSNGDSTKYLTAYSNNTTRNSLTKNSLLGGTVVDTSFTKLTEGGINVSITGDAISEVWNNLTYAWFKDESYFLNNEEPFFKRGGGDYSSDYGLFTSLRTTGADYLSDSSTNHGWRITLPGLLNTTNCTHSFSDWTILKEPCVETGLQKRICTKCGYTETQEIAVTGEHTGADGICTVCGQEFIISDGSWDGTINTPILADGMTAVAWDEDGNEFIPKTNAEWYDYTDQAEGTDATSKWANAKTSDGSYWVWIPRYEYKIDASNLVETTDAGTIDVRFIPTTTNSSTSGYTTTTEVNQTLNGVEVLSKGISVSSDGYIIHPAFTNNVDVGGWDSELQGFWVAKYEMSMETNGVATTTVDETIGNVAISDKVKAVSKPGVPVWRNINVSNAYENSLDYDSSKESHLMKNSEWGAVAYLTHSSYGRNGKQVDMNACEGLYTGAGPTAEGDTSTTYEYDASTFSSTYAYDTDLGQLASSTGNITGIYDLSGCAPTFVAAFNSEYSSDGVEYSLSDSCYASASGTNMGAIGLVNEGSSKYLTAYSNSSDQYSLGQG